MKIADLRISYKTGREGAKQAKPATVWPCVARAAANLHAAKTAAKELSSTPLTAESTAKPAELRPLRDRDYRKELTACTQRQILQATSDRHKVRLQAEEESQLPSIEAAICF